MLTNPATPALEVSQESCGEGENERAASVGRVVLCPAVGTALRNGSWEGQGTGLDPWCGLSLGGGGGAGPS